MSRSTPARGRHVGRQWMRGLRIGFLFLVAGGWGCTSGDKVDDGFDTRVAAPAYAASGPRVLFDEAHHNWHRAGKSYRPFVRLITADGYRVDRGRDPVSPEGLRSYAVYVVAGAVGENDRNDDPAFSESECAAIRDWVAGGGSLLLIVDHFPFGDAAQGLAAAFGIVLHRGTVEDSTRFDPDYEPTHLVFSRENGGLVRHPIVDGRSETERVNRVLTFTGTAVAVDSLALTGEASAVGFLGLSPAARARPARPRVERKGNDVLVHVEYGAPEPVPGWSQGLALELGKGRVVVLGEAAMLSARFARYDGKPIGMNTPGYDNRQLALNIMHWLTRVL